MNGGAVRKDLFVLAADLGIANAIGSLLGRPQSLGIGKPSFDIERHPGRDSGCRTGADNHLRPFRDRYRYALVVFDRHGCNSDLPRAKIQQEVELRLEQGGWQERSKAIVIDPEIETWVWNASPHTADVLGWNGDYPKLQGWLETQGCWRQGCPKPPEPKKAMTMAVRQTRVRRSPRLFSCLAAKASPRHCTDPAFDEFRATLRSWFPPRR